jgi:hypothetical protein
MHREHISIWLFIGSLLLVYGIMILAQGLYELAVPPAEPRVLGEYHATIWWGALLLVIGVVYTWKFWPKKG